MEKNEFKDIINEVVTEIEEKHTGNMRNVLTGFVDIDNTIGGLNKSNLIVIAGKPAMGRSTLASNIAVNVANQDIPVALFNLGMSKKEYIKRVICSQAMVDIAKFNKAELEEDDWTRLANITPSLWEKEIYLEDNPVISISQIKEKCLKLKEENNIGLIVIDSLQEIQRHRNYISQEQEIEKMSKSLRELSQEINTPIILISEVSNEPDKRYYCGKDPRPKLSDLHTAIVKDADIIMFLYRDDFYNKNSEKKDIAEIIIAKNRHENRTTVELLVIEKYFKFLNLEKRFDDNDDTVEDIQSKEITLKQKLECLKEYTKVLDNINIDDVKVLEKNYRNEDIYILLNNGDMYCNGVLQDRNIESFFSLQGLEQHMYKIKKDNTIVPMQSTEEWDDLDFHLHNENRPYKKIVTHNSEMIALTLDNKVVSVNFMEYMGTVPDNFIDVDDVLFKEDEHGFLKQYIIKKGEEIPLYIGKEW